MTTTPDTEDRRKHDERRIDPRPDDVPAPRPNDEVPNNRQEAPRADRDNEQEKKDRRGS